MVGWFGGVWRVCGTGLVGCGVGAFFDAVVRGVQDVVVWLWGWSGLCGGVVVICPYCGENEDKVIDSRSSEAGRVIRRRRQCVACGKRFTTYERIEETVRLMVIKRDGSRQAFARESVMKGVRLACGKRPVSEEMKTALVDGVEDEVHRNFDREVESREIGELVAARLRELDDIAYVRFASEYYQFKSVGDIMSQLEELTSRVRDVKDQGRLFDDGRGGVASGRSEGDGGS